MNTENHEFSNQAAWLVEFFIHIETNTDSRYHKVVNKLFNVHFDWEGAT